MLLATLLGVFSAQAWAQDPKPISKLHVQYVLDRWATGEPVCEAFNEKCSSRNALTIHGDTEVARATARDCELAGMMIRNYIGPASRSKAQANFDCGEDSRIGMELLFENGNLVSFQTMDGGISFDPIYTYDPAKVRN
jgi:hypothetical protein